jgi:hypothetical protein
MNFFFFLSIIHSICLIELFEAREDIKRMIEILWIEILSIPIPFPRNGSGVPTEF